MLYIGSGATWERTYLDILWSIWLLLLLFFLCFPHLCIRSHLTVSWFSEILNKDYRTVKTDSINTMVSPILHVAVWIYKKDYIYFIFHGLFHRYSYLLGHYFSLLTSATTTSRWP